MLLPVPLILRFDRTHLNKSSIFEGVIQSQYQIQMKKSLLAVAVVATFGLASCGGPSICDCVELDEEWREAEDQEAWEEENKDKIEACEELEDELIKEYEDASDEEKEELIEKWEKEFEDCEMGVTKNKTREETKMKEYE